MPNLAGTTQASLDPAAFELLEQEAIKPKPQCNPKEQRKNSATGTTVVAHEVQLPPRRDCLSPFELKIHTASQASSSSKGASQASSKGAFQSSSIGTS